MESGGRNKQEKSKFPMIIAMKGPSSSEKREISRKLAASLQYPLIDEEDIIPSLQSFIPTSSSNSSNILSDKYSNGLPFKIVAQISSTQLDSKLRVIELLWSSFNVDLKTMMDMMLGVFQN
ncbi:conserved hypothetical protein [Ricinus communis]|uniref:Adenylate kinase n=1 Tax=Ricinus communis TaxID=3988 RepID=B9SMS6_RICCO|nr:conserved hypothetical protein [Ricinus communis]